ncbi:MAG: putative DNA binding domain-containing protein [Clostridia bacterium]|nr:putative DNA binding domain-containing protein [Clostridia bacterium]
MNHDDIKRMARECLTAGKSESDCIEYKKSHFQKDSILKTMCAFANNLSNRPVCLMIIGVNEHTAAELKGKPALPIEGITQSVETVENSLRALTSYIRPKIEFDVTSDELDGKEFVVAAFSNNPQGPYEVTYKAEKDKEIGLRSGRYVRVESESRIASVREEFELLRKFSNYHFSEELSSKATLDDLDIDYLREYLHQASSKDNTYTLSKEQIVRNMNLVDELSMRVKNFAILMFARTPEKFIPESYVELIHKSNIGESVMVSKEFRGPVWKQVKKVMDEIQDKYLESVTVRTETNLESKTVYNFPYSTCEELITNAIVHKNYENPRTIQIYLYDDSIVITNYNRPMPPVTVRDLNTKSAFPDRGYENPSLREMFKALDLIESFGSGIGKAKSAMAKNDNVTIHYKEYDDAIDITSVVIPISPTYVHYARMLGKGAPPEHRYDIDTNDFIVSERSCDFYGRPQPLKHLCITEIYDIVDKSNYSRNVKTGIMTIYNKFEDKVFSSAEIANVLGSALSSGTNYVSYMMNLGLIKKVSGQGKGKYRFV